MKTSDLDEQLRAFGVHSVGCCDECRTKASLARDAKAAAETDHHGAPEHIKRAVLAEHDRRIAEHHDGMLTHARRAAWAEEGWLIDGPHERVDAEHGRRYGSLRAAAYAAGRVHQVDAYDDGLDDEPDE